MGGLLLTVAYGKEAKARLEVLDCVFQMDPNAVCTRQPYGGLLMLETALPSDEAAVAVSASTTACVRRIIPIDSVVKSDIGAITSEALRLVPAGACRVAVDCSRRGRALPSSLVVEKALGALLKARGKVIDLARPDVVIRIDIIGSRTTISVRPPSGFITKKDVRLMADFKVGKVPNDVLKRLVYGRLGAPDPSIILGPNIGEDAALIRHGGGILAFKSDPITGSVEEVGALAVYVNANDIATRGAMPRWFLQCILMPEGSSETDLGRIVSQIDEAARELGVSVVGGHTEVTRGISRPIVVGSMIGTFPGSRYFTSSGARVGDLLLMTKWAGIEGTVILSSEAKVKEKLGQGFGASAKALRRMINVVPECLTLSAVDGISAMHDLTEGGVMGGVWELAEAASLGVELGLSEVPVMDTTEQLCKALGLDPYRLISSGSIVFTVRPDRAEAAEASLGRAGIASSRIGRMVPLSGKRRYRDLRGRWRRLLPPSPDELWKGVHH